MNLLKKASVLFLALTLFFTSSYGTVSAASNNSTIANGTYDLDVKFMNSSNINNTSMCNSLFYEKITAKVNGSTTEITMYVLDPIPTYQSAGQPITEMTISYSETADTTYQTVIDNTNLVTKTFNTSFGGDIIGDYPCDVVTATIPTQALLDSASGVLTARAFVNAIMQSYVNFYIVVDTSTLKPAATESSTYTSTITATVAVDSPDYYVTIPATIDLGNLSKTEDTSVDYQVKVEVANLADSSYVTVSAPTTGHLVSGANSIPFSNTFGSKEFTSTTTETASILVEPANVKEAGSYTGTTTFEINYYE